MSVTKREFGTLADGRKVWCHIIENRRGLRAEILDYGAILVSLVVPDQDGKPVDVTLGYDELSKYEDNFDMLGATVGRNVNRIEKGTFSLGGMTYHLEINENDNNIHSSMAHGFHKVMWTADSFADDSVTLRYISRDGENGFPGALNTALTYTLTDAGALMLSYEMVCDRRTLANLTNHAYFNLAGVDSGDILDTVVWINADAFTPIRRGTIPTGEIRAVEGTPMDFRMPKPIGRDMGLSDEQLRLGQGYDHNFVLRGQNAGVRRVATAYSPKSGIRMTVYTDLPGLQFYGGNTTRDIIGKGGHLITRHSGFCMESHYYPNSINIPSFPQPVIEANAIARTTTIYSFDTEA
ncbi:MAG: aldose epimerase family protein [Eubacteriales bacterium]